MIGSAIDWIVMKLVQLAAYAAPCEQSNKTPSHQKFVEEEERRKRRV